MSNAKKLGIFALTLLITGAIDSIRNLPATALFGSSLFFFFILAAIFFLIPTALISAELTANLPAGGIYQWTRLAFGKRAAFCAIWLQWINNIIWFPTMLSFIAGTLAYLIDPNLVQNKYYLIGIILTLFWLLTLANLRGIYFSSRITSFCAVIGLLIPMVFIIGLFSVWLILGNPIQLTFTAQSLLPDLTNNNTWISLTAIIFGFAGMELATVHIRDVQNPRTTFPFALLASTILILVTMGVGSLAIACIIPSSQINLLNGAIQTFDHFLTAFHLTWLLPILVLLLLAGSIGGIISWMISPIKGLDQAAADGFLSPGLSAKNDAGMPQPLFLIQAVVVSLICVVFFLFPNVNASYWFLSALSTQLYILMYLWMFFSALKLCGRFPPANAFTIPGGKLAVYGICGLGIIGCLVTFAVGFIPPVNLNIGSPVYYESIFVTGLIIMLLPLLFFYRYQRRKNQQENDQAKELIINPTEMA